MHQFFPSLVYCVYRMSARMGGRSGWDRRNGTEATEVSVGEMSTKLKIAVFGDPRKGRCGAAFRGFCFVKRQPRAMPVAPKRLYLCVEKINLLR